MFKPAHSLLLCEQNLDALCALRAIFFAATMPKHGGLCCGESGPGSRGADLVNSTRVSNAFPKEARCAIEFC